MLKRAPRPANPAEFKRIMLLLDRAVRNTHSRVCAPAWCTVAIRGQKFKFWTSLAKVDKPCVFQDWANLSGGCRSQIKLLTTVVTFLELSWDKCSLFGPNVAFAISSSYNTYFVLRVLKSQDLPKEKINQRRRLIAFNCEHLSEQSVKSFCWWVLEWPL